jgi:hypothetical protein
MRVNKSAMGSLMLMFGSPVAYQLALTMPGISPAKAISRIFGARQAKMLERATGATGDGTTVTLTGWVRIARELLQPQTGSSTLFVGAFAVTGNCLEFRVFLGVLGNQFVTLQLALD